MKDYRVYLHSKPGHWTYYDGHVDVVADNEEDAEQRAKDKLRRTAFPDRWSSSWIVDKVEAQK